MELSTLMGIVVGSILILYGIAGQKVILLITMIFRLF